MKTKRWSVTLIAFFALFILARQITGAPNAQVAFAGNLTDEGFHSPQSGLSQTYLHDDQTELAPESSNLDITKGEAQKTGYKKYVSPEKIILAVSIKNLEGPRVTTLHIQDLWLVRDLPIEVLAHAPPSIDVFDLQLHHFDFEGEFTFEKIDDQCGGRFCLSGTRST